MVISDHGIEGVRQPPADLRFATFGLSQPRSRTLPSWWWFAVDSLGRDLRPGYSGPTARNWGTGGGAVYTRTYQSCDFHHAAWIRYKMIPNKPDRTSGWKDWTGAS
jgi:hypothetical protein